MKREPVTDFGRTMVGTWWVCDPCPGLGFGRYVMLDMPPLPSPSPA